ncbi:hypothetical protein PMAYCL1PPCAC_13043, partial [Pristionchus mayeri]
RGIASFKLEDNDLDLLEDARGQLIPFLLHGHVIPSSETAKLDKDGWVIGPVVIGYARTQAKIGALMRGIGDRFPIREKYSFEVNRRWRAVMCMRNVADASSLEGTIEEGDDGAELGKVLYPRISSDLMPAVLGSKLEIHAVEPSLWKDSSFMDKLKVGFEIITIKQVHGWIEVRF